tara:strand:+ start:615 stop:935 length:321 start_codon:yes stop_codon:yes gene_type:complete
MFKKSVIISLSIFFILMIITSIVKNNTRNIEKNIEKLGGEVSTLEKELADAKIDFIYLSTPERLQKKITDLSKIKYFSYDHSSIFLSTEDFIRHTSQETKKFKIKK